VAGQRARRAPVEPRPNHQQLHGEQYRRHRSEAENRAGWSGDDQAVSRGGRIEFPPDGQFVALAEPDELPSDAAVQLPG